jgi:hypothetical protein
MAFHDPLIPYIEKNVVCDGEIHTAFERQPLLWGKLTPKGSSSFDDVDPIHRRFAKSMYELLLRTAPFKMFHHLQRIKKFERGDQTLFVTRPFQEIKRGVLQTQVVELMDHDNPLHMNAHTNAQITE